MSHEGKPPLVVVVLPPFARSDRDIGQKGAHMSVPFFYSVAVSTGRNFTFHHDGLHNRSTGITK